MRCWRGRLGLQAWRGMTWAAAVSKAKRKQTLRGGERSMCSFQGRVPTIRGGRTSEQQQGPWGSAKHVIALQTISSPVLNCRLFSSNAGNGDESEGQDDPPVFVPPVFQRVSSQLPGNRRRRAWEKSLSPLERVSRLVPEEFLSEEISAMRNSEIKESKQEPPAGEQDSSLFSRSIPQAQSHLNQGLAPEHLLNSASKNIPLQVGELILAEFQRRYSDIKKLFRLTAGGMLNGSWGTIHFVEIVGKLPGQLFLTSIGRIVLIRRPTLEEYVLLMRRGPTISYPKDMAAMLLLMDLNQGDKVLEVGSGSGALSLFLSRAVGPLGNVMSYEVRKDHHSIAKTNYQNWCAAWKLAHVVEWPDNVEFINEDIATAAEDLKMETFDAIALDMVTPQKALPVIPSLKQGGVCAVYVANITQVIALLEAIHTSKSTLFCEKIVEVTHRDWLIRTVMQKSGSAFQHMKCKENMVDDPTCSSENEEQSAEQEVSVSDRAKTLYVARPHHWQTSHTVFLVKLRKFNPPNPKTSPDTEC